MGETISIFGLGSCAVAKASWLLNAAGFYDHVLELLRQLNPRMENLHDCHGRTVEKVGQVSVSILGSDYGTPARQTEPGLMGRRIAGTQLPALVRRSAGEAEYDLADLRVFPDGIVQLGGLPSEEVLDVDGLRSAVGAGRIFASLRPAIRIHIAGLGSFTTGEEVRSTDPHQQLLEVLDNVEKLNNRPDSAARCREAYEAYVKDPTEELQAALRIAYEAVPQHRRRFLGDQDVKDIPIRMIIYGDQELEKWSHRVAARERGLSLPGIKVPRPPKK